MISADWSRVKLMNKTKRKQSKPDFDLTVELPAPQAALLPTIGGQFLTDAGIPANRQAKLRKLIRSQASEVTLPFSDWERLHVAATKAGATDRQIAYLASVVGGGIKGALSRRATSKRQTTQRRHVRDILDLEGCRQTTDCDCRICKFNVVGVSTATGKPKAGAMQKGLF